MKKIVIYFVILISLSNCNAQQKTTNLDRKIVMCYMGHKYTETQNTSFLNQELMFIKDKDSLIMNIKIPFDMSKSEILKQNVFYDCVLKIGIIYTFTLKKICGTEIPSEINSYYKTNTVFSETNCSKFTETKKNTAYLSKGNYGKYIDIDNELYEIINLSPSDECKFFH
jgi:hypothetical protein